MNKKRTFVQRFRKTTRFPGLNEDSGSALVLVLFLALLLTILGVAVLGATLSGSRVTETRESDVQSLHLAQKGLDEATAYIESKLSGMTNIDPDKLEAILAPIHLKNLNVTTELGTIGNTADGEIQEITYSGRETVTDSGQQSRKYYIDVITSAKVNGVNRNLRQRITLDTYPDFLKYAFGSESNLILNGAPLLKGNIYAGKQLLISNNAKYTYKGNSNLNTDTLFPTVARLKDLSRQDSGGEVHVQSWDSFQYTDGSKIAKNRIGEALTIPQDQVGERVKIKEEKNFVQINVEESFLDKLVQAKHPATESQADDIREKVRSQYRAGSLNSWLMNESALTQLEKPELPKKEPISADDTPEIIAAKEKRYEDAMKAYLNTLDTQLGSDRVPFANSAVYRGNLRIDNVDYKRIAFSEAAKQGNGVSIGAGAPSWLIVAGDLTIDNYNADYLPIKGNVLVTGNLTIRGNVQFDATVFVLGTTTVEDATIQGLNGKELIVISKQKILLTRIESFSNLAQEMKAFFYTDSSADLYGVGSIFWLNGGFFAKGDLTINAVVGKVQPPAGTSAGSGFIFQKPQQSTMDARFKVEYNHSIYTDQQSSLPRVKTVSINVGPMELVN